MPSETLSDLQRKFFERGAFGIEEPEEADYVYASATSAAGATAVATLPAVAGKRNYLLGFVITSTNPAAAVNGVVTVTGLGTTLSFQFVESTTLGGKLVVQFSKPLPASALNTAIAVTLPAIATGGLGAVAAWGYVR